MQYLERVLIWLHFYIAVRACSFLVPIYRTNSTYPPYKHTSQVKSIVKIDNFGGKFTNVIYIFHFLSVNCQFWKLPHY